MPNTRWQPTPQECELIADMLAANRPKAAITAVTGIIADLQRCDHAAPDLLLDHFQQLLAKLERGPRNGSECFGQENDND